MGNMQFMVKYNVAPEYRDQVQQQFKATGGLPPEGVEMLGRWHNAPSLCGYILCETDNPVAIGKWFQEWTHILSFEVEMVVS
ncbi:MAG TPA: hypothetical protein DEB44_10040, partial [Acidimicrobiaceae bacterium]|nr:hypothetical protein [Acidimicrobiaceae bacterium]